MAVHVDNFIYGGTHAFINTVISQLRTIFKIGSGGSEGIKYVGISIKQNSRGISLSTDAYCSSLTEIYDIGIDKNRTLKNQDSCGVFPAN